ncbi:hypothetical protein FXO38_07803 [Capsicum annuum]|nr:hypothetical protein FXO38_07803 [Capsicum annuum]KAF3671166.1 hypothetical protein FXO37_08166 [Capsicum annuum]
MIDRLRITWTGMVDLDFYKNLKDRYDDLNMLMSTIGGAGCYCLLAGLQWDKEMIKYVRGEMPNPHGKIWIGTKRILGVINVDRICYREIEILLEKEKIKSELMDNFLEKVLMKQPWDFEGQNKDMTFQRMKSVPCAGRHRNNRANDLSMRQRSGKHARVWVYGVLTGLLDLVYKEEPMK